MLIGGIINYSAVILLERELAIYGLILGTGLCTAGFIIKMKEITSKKVE
jgi:hypothetical protein